jgi:hypothetical protein
MHDAKRHQHGGAIGMAADGVVSSAKPAHRPGALTRSQARRGWTGVAARMARSARRSPCRPGYAEHDHRDQVAHRTLRRLTLKVAAKRRSDRAPRRLNRPAGVNNTFEKRIG